MRAKFEIRNPKQCRNSNEQKTMENKNSRKYDLEDRTLLFAKRSRELVSRLPKSLVNIDDIKQLLRSSGSVGANYIEANEALSKKDFLMRIKICRKEAKESRYWLTLLNVDKAEDLKSELEGSIREATELMNIFGSIVRKVE